MIVVGDKVKRVFLEEGGVDVPIGSGKALVFTDTFSKLKTLIDQNPAVIHGFYSA